MSFIKKLCCCFSCCKKEEYLNEINSQTVLLPVDPNSTRINKKKHITDNKLYIYGSVNNNIINNNITNTGASKIVDLSVYSNSCRVKKIVCGDEHALILFTDNILLSYGRNTFGQLGVNIVTDNIITSDIDKENTNNKDSKIHLNNKEQDEFNNINYNIKCFLNKLYSNNKLDNNVELSYLDIAAGSNFSLVLIKPIVINNNIEASEDVKKIFSKNILIRLGIKEKDIYDDDINQLNYISIETVKDLKDNNEIKSIYAFKNRSLLISNNNYLFVGGKNYDMSYINGYVIFFHLGNKEVKQLCMGSEHCLILDVDNNLYGAGDNTYGELGLANAKLIEVPVKITYFNSIANDIVKIATGLRNSFVLLKSGEIYVFGDNSEGQSTGFNSRYSIPTLINLNNDLNDKIIDIISGHNHVIAKGQSKLFYSWGSSTEGKLCYNELKQSSNYPKLIQNLKGREVDYIYAGKNSSFITTYRQ